MAKESWFCQAATLRVDFSRGAVYTARASGGQAPFPEFHNVYVQPEAFAEYRETGKWPESTMLLKELQLARLASNGWGGL